MNLNTLKKSGFTIINISDPESEQESITIAEININEFKILQIDTNGIIVLSEIDPNTEDINEVNLGQVNSIEQFLYIYKTIHAINTTNDYIL